MVYDIASQAHVHLQHVRYKPTLSPGSRCITLNNIKKNVTFPLQPQPKLFKLPVKPSGQRVYGLELTVTDPWWQCEEVQPVVQ